MYVRNREVCWKKGDFSSFFYQSLILLLNAGRGRVFLRGTQLFIILEHLACLPWNFTVQEPATCSHWRKLKTTIGVVWFLHRKSNKGLGSGATHHPATGTMATFLCQVRRGPWRTQGVGVSTWVLSQLTELPEGARSHLQKEVVGRWGRDPNDASSWERNHRWPPRIETHAFLRWFQVRGPTPEPTECMALNRTKDSY